MKGWICNACLRKDLCICSGSDDTTVVDLLSFDDQPTQVFRRPRRETLNGYRYEERAEYGAGAK